MFGYEEELQEKIEKLREENNKLKEQLGEAVGLFESIATFLDFHQIRYNDLDGKTYILDSSKIIDFLDRIKEVEL